MESLIDIEDFPGRSVNENLPDDDHGDHDNDEDHNEGRQ